MTTIKFGNSTTFHYWNTIGPAFISGTGWDQILIHIWNTRGPDFYYLWNFIPKNWILCINRVLSSNNSGYQTIPRRSIEAQLTSLEHGGTSFHIWNTRGPDFLSFNYVMSSDNPSYQKIPEHSIEAQLTSISRTRWIQLSYRGHERTRFVWFNYVLSSDNPGYQTIPEHSTEAQLTLISGTR